MNATLHSRRRAIALIATALAAGVTGLRASAEDKVIRVVARRFSFAPDRIALARGVPVVLELTSADVLMGFNAPDFGVRADIVPGQVARVRIVPDKVGSFPFLCDIFCGSGHEGMSGVIAISA